MTIQVAPSKMRTILRHPSPQGPYTASYTIVTCIDHRFTALRELFSQSLGVRERDVIQIAGGAVDLAHGFGHVGREFLLDRIHKSLALHVPETIYLMAHTDCGACSNELCPEFYTHKLRLARKTVLEHFEPKGFNIKVIPLFADFDGLHEAQV